MNKTNIEYNGFLFPAVEIEGKKIDPECKGDEVYVVADIASFRMTRQKKKSSNISRGSTCKKKIAPVSNF